MTTQPEQILEDNLVAQLIGMDYEPVAVRDEASLLNNLKAQLAVFAGQFLEKCHLAKMVTRFPVLNESKKMLMVMRPYQVYPTEDIILNPYDDYVKEFNQGFFELLRIAPSVNSVTQLVDEEQELAFIKTFRNLTRLLNVLKTFTEFTFDDLSMPAQSFEDYKSKHLDLLSGETELRSKRELIERFIEKHLPQIDDPADIPEEFEICWQAEQRLAFEKLAEEEGLDIERLEKLLGDYLFTSKKPLRNDVVDAMNERPALRERASTAARIIDKIFNFVDTFINGT